MTTRATVPALPRALAAPAPNGSPLAFTLALLGAALVHLFLILAVSFEMPKPSSQPLPEGALEFGPFASRREAMKLARHFSAVISRRERER